jgi:hypothetical protein
VNRVVTIVKAVAYFRPIIGSGSTVFLPTRPKFPKRSKSTRTEEGSNSVISRHHLLNELEIEQSFAHSISSCKSSKG